ncbi:MAG: anti-sigma factor [Ilumatobacteraceae bacterium]
MNDDERIAYLAGDPAGPMDDLDERADLDELRALLADPGLWDEPAPALEDAVVDAVTTAAGAGAPLPRPASSAETGPGESATRVIPIDRHRSRRGVVLLGAVAAAAIAVVAAVVVTTGGQDGAETFSMTLAPTELLPDASGTATLTKTDSGWQIELDASGLPRLDAGRFYQAWLRNVDGELVPVGTFNEGADVVLWAGVPPVEFPTLTITEEAADGDQGSSGVRVLAGTIAPADD